MTSKKSDGKLKWTGEKVRQSYIDLPMQEWSNLKMSFLGPAHENILGR
jgi:hypothetical protein